MQQGKTGDIIGGTSSGPSGRTPGARNSTPCRLISTNSSHLCELVAELGNVKVVCIPPSGVLCDVRYWLSLFLQSRENLCGIKEA